MSHPGTEKRRHPRLNLHAVVLIAASRGAWLATLRDVSEGGLRAQRPLDFPSTPERRLRLFVMLDQDTVIDLHADLIRMTDADLGFAFVDGQAEEIGRLMYESRFLSFEG